MQHLQQALRGVVAMKGQRTEVGSKAGSYGSPAGDYMQAAANHEAEGRNGEQAKPDAAVQP